MELLVSRRRVLTTDILPYDSEVEWLRGVNDACIYTGLVNVTSDKITKWEGDAGFLASAFYQQRGFIAGYNNDNYSHYAEFREQSNVVKFGCYGNYSDLSLVPETLYPVSIEINGGTETILKIIVNDVEHSYTITSGQSSTMGRFRIFGIDSLYRGDGVLVGKNKLWYEGQLIRDFIPVRKETTGCMYDRVNNELVYPPGGSSFVVGPDVVP